MNFQNTYSRPEYLDFFRDTLLPEDFEILEESVSPGFQADRIKQITKIGEVPSLDLPVFEIKHKSENDPRVTLSKEAFRVLANYGKQQALILFVSTAAANFRLSLVTLELKFEGKRVSKEFSNPRRYSFFLGPQSKAHTPEEYLVKKGRIKDLDDLNNRFSIEVVNKEFYTQIALLFTQLTGGSRKISNRTYEEKGILKLPDTKDETIKKEFAVRLIGRLIFCWFLKKKTSQAGIPLIPQEVLSANAIIKSKKDPAVVGGYYHGILEPLFFEVLNRPVGERKKRYKNSHWKLIPFLNGGLFTPHDHDFYLLDDQDRSAHINTMKVSDDWLKELLSLFETYNFTIDENTPVDVELSIEPEMLGRIFENLLAEINPETGDTARKSTGSYYTPRSIVEYMVDESLKQYLITKTGITEDKVASLLSYADEDGSKLTEKQTESLVESLHAVKIIDPACGSGAFPLGILQKILLMLQKLDPDSKIWLNKMLSVIPDPIYREELKKKKLPNYLHKLGIIKDCIFGVDIQPIAVEISKLRCFLSLIVDEKVIDDTDNRGIEHLPNLEFKFVCANTLIGLPEKTKKEKTKKGTFDQTQLFEATDKIDELKELRDLYLTSYGSEKKKIEKRFRKLQSEMFQHDLDVGGQAKQTATLAQWNPFSDEASSWFDPDWMYGIKDGFDIVIANPPYINIANLNARYRNLYKNIFQVSKNKTDIFAFFIERADLLLRNNGIVTYIIPHTWKATTSFSKLRDFILEHFQLRKIVELNFGVFDAVVKPVVIFLTKEKRNDYVISILNEHFEVFNSISYKEILAAPEHAIDTISDNNQKNLFKKIEDNCVPLSKIIEFSRAIKTSNDKKFIVKKRLNDEYKKIFRGKNIKAYSLNWNGEYIWYRPDLMKKKVGCLPHSREFFEVPEKLITQRVNSSMQLLVAYDDGQNYFLDTTNVSRYTSWDKKYSLKFICGLLNSKLINFWYCNKFRMPTIGIYELHSIPVRPILPKEQEPYIILVDKILAAKKENPKADTTKLEEQLDQMVYKLYGLTNKEIFIVEESV